MCKRHWKYKSGVPVKEEIIIVVHFANIFELRITSMIFISGRPLLWRDGQSGLLGQVVRVGNFPGVKLSISRALTLL